MGRIEQSWIVSDNSFHRPTRNDNDGQGQYNASFPVAEETHR